ncbi:Ribosomal polymerase II subunit RPB7 [Giardia duodenalis assemblage B]|uniref:Ribosomal polymerase II subunit RPB7 n=3 Tax=Giardia intestinalis TaxID=5741 RepID=A0A132NVM8_GIAIN|nr:RNA polymerase RPB7 superfamily [Giardia intestinalis]KWX14108.1 Ribosomal polymerase II subunit RPB7 [Giardia intestinalis assemblage B]
MEYIFITLWLSTSSRQMLFHIEATETVQLRPCDFHEHYATAVIALMKEQLFNGVSHTFGKVLQVMIHPDSIPKTPLLQPHTGVATFQVAYKAIIERPMRNERAIAYVESIERSNDNFFILKLLLGSYILETTILDKLYRETSTGGLELVEENYSPREDSVFRLEKINQGDFVRIIVTSSDSCQLLDVAQEDDMESDEEGRGYYGDD